LPLSVKSYKALTTSLKNLQNVGNNSFYSPFQHVCSPVTPTYITKLQPCCSWH